MHGPKKIESEAHIINIFVLVLLQEHGNILPIAMS
jgi:hypothetical protein